MKNLLIVGPVDAAAQDLLRDLATQAKHHVTLYTPSQVTVPAGITALTNEPLDEGGLSAAMVGQDAVVALVPTIQLATTTQTLVTAAQAAGLTQVLITRTDDIDDLPLQVRRARQQLSQTALNYDLVTGVSSVEALLGITPAPAEVAPFPIPFKKIV